MSAPIVIKPIPAQVINEGAAYGPFNLKDYIQGESINFSAALDNGNALPTGMICTADGTLTGIPAKHSQGIYHVVITAENAEGSVDAEFDMTIKAGLTDRPANYFDELKSQIWEAVGNNLPIPDLGELANRPISIVEYYYLLERWGILRVWDAFNLDPPGELHLLNLEGTSKHFNVYDRGSCIVAVPKDLFSHERTLLDGIVTAQAVAREVYKRGWTVELVGLDKYTRSAWLEIQHLGDQYGKQLEVINYQVSPQDVKLYTIQAQSPRRGPSIE